MSLSCNADQPTLTDACCTGLNMFTFKAQH